MVPAGWRSEQTWRTEMMLSRRVFFAGEVSICSRKAGVFMCFLNPSDSFVNHSTREVLVVHTGRVS